MTFSRQELAEQAASWAIQPVSVDTSIWKNHTTLARIALGILSLQVAFSVTGTGMTVDPTEVWPTRAWPLSTPEMQGMDSAPLADALEFARQRQINIHSLLIIRNGFLVLDAYFYPYRRGATHDVASVTKSITSMLVGIATDRGYLLGDQQPVVDIFAERNIKNLDDQKRAVTLAHLLTMTSGLDCRYETAEPTLREMMHSQEWVPFMLDLPMVAKPGSHFVYCSGGFHLLSGIISHKTGQSALEFARNHLFGPLGIKEVRWPSDPQGVSRGWGDLRMLPQDMAKIGYLFLKQGQWKGRQVLHPSWIAKSTQSWIELPGREQSYGYGWWVYPHRTPMMYEALGRGGQRISVCPEKNLVAVLTGGGFEPGDFKSFIDAALKSDHPLSPNPGAYARLEDAVRSAANPPAPAAVPPMPMLAREISGKTYRLGQNSLGLQTVCLHFDKTKVATLEITLPEGHFVLPVGLDGVYRFANRAPGNNPAALKGLWESENRFALSFNTVSGINTYRMKMTFLKDSLELSLDEATGLLREKTEGRAAD
jgi:CubicO group peptidase (beta-lactamase class C family)